MQSGIYDPIQLALIGEDPELAAALAEIVRAHRPNWKVTPLRSDLQTASVLDELGVQVAVVCASTKPSETLAMLWEIAAEAPRVVRVFSSPVMERGAPAHWVIVQPAELAEVLDIIEFAYFTWLTLDETG